MRPGLPGAPLAIGALAAGSKSSCAIRLADDRPLCDDLLDRSGMTQPLWPAGAATGLGSMPGTDIRAALQAVLDEVPDFIHLPELPARGPGAELVGRTAGLLVDLPVQLYAGRWQIADHPGRDLRRTADLWERDPDALTERGGELRVWATPWHEERVLPALRALLELPFEHVVVSHGEPLHDRAAFERALELPPFSD